MTCHYFSQSGAAARRSRSPKRLPPPTHAVPPWGTASMSEGTGRLKLGLGVRNEGGGGSAPLRQALEAALTLDLWGLLGPRLVAQEVREE